MRNYLRFPILIATALSLFSGASIAVNNEDVVRTDALSYDTLQNIDNKAVIEFESNGKGSVLPEGESATVKYSGGALSYDSTGSGSYPNLRLFAARMYTGNYSCSPINEEEQAVYINGVEKTKTVNTTGGYAWHWDSGAKITVSYTSSKEKWADLYVRVAGNDVKRDSATPTTNSMKLSDLMSINLNNADDNITISDKAMVFGRILSDHSIDNEFNITKSVSAVKYAYEQDTSGNWIYKTTEAETYGRYTCQDWQTVLVGKVKVNSGENTFVYTRTNKSGYLDCMILDFDKYDNKDVYEFEEATLEGGAYSVANYTGGYKDIIQDFTTYNKDYACSNHDFVKNAKQGASLTFNNISSNNYINPHLVLRVSSLQVDQGKYITSSVQASNYLKIEVNGTKLDYAEDLYIEGRNDSANRDPDGIAHGDKNSGSLTYVGSNNDNIGASIRYMYIIWRTIDFGAITLNEGTTNTIKLSIIGGGTEEYIAYDYLSIEDVDDSTSAAKTFANTYLGRLGNVCKPDGSTNVNSLKKVWADMRASYDGLSSESQTIIIRSKAIYGSTDPIERWLERYEYIGPKYNTQLVDDGNWNFLNRSLSTVSTSLLPKISMSNNYLLLTIIVIASTISITAFVVIIKKNKFKKQ